MLTVYVLVLAAAGLLISTYFTAVTYRWIRPDASWIPPVCRMGEQTCAAIVFTPRARVLGPPNSVLGQIFYVALIASAASSLLARPPVLGMLLAASFLTVLLAIFLTYSLLFVTRVRCVLCLASHAINVVIFVCLLGMLGR